MKWVDGFERLSPEQREWVRTVGRSAAVGHLGRFRRFVRMDNATMRVILTAATEVAEMELKRAQTEVRELDGALDARTIQRVLAHFLVKRVKWRVNDEIRRHYPWSRHEESIEGQDADFEGPSPEDEVLRKENSHLGMARLEKIAEQHNDKGAVARAILDDRSNGYKNVMTDNGKGFSNKRIAEAVWKLTGDESWIQTRRAEYALRELKDDIRSAHGAPYSNPPQSTQSVTVLRRPAADQVGLQRQAAAIRTIRGDDNV